MNEVTKESKEKWFKKKTIEWAKECVENVKRDFRVESILVHTNLYEIRKY